MTKDVVAVELEKIRERRKAKKEALSHEQNLVGEIGKWTLWCITAFFTGLAVCLAVWRVL